MNVESLIRKFGFHLRIERGYSENTIAGYLHDVGLLSECHPSVFIRLCVYFPIYRNYHGSQSHKAEKEYQ